ncbi:MAG: ABC transporter ATP-binding protein [Thermomicrobiales bacterium]
MTIIQAERLAKDFRRPKRVDGRFSTVRTLFTHQTETTQAVHDVSLSVAEGEIVGYLGPNGAGKSTTIKMLTGILVPTSGTCRVAGLVPWENRARNAMNIGVVFGQRSQLWWDLPLDESLRLIGKMYSMSDDRFRRNRDQLVELLGMEPFLSTPVRQLSLGQRMRGDLAAAVLYEPPVLFLDEPTVGLDVVGKERIRTFIEEINQTRRTTVLLTTHDLEDVERLCKRLVIIDHGRVLFDGAASELVLRYAPYRLLDIAVRADAAQAMMDIVSSLPPGVALVSQSDIKSSFQTDPETVPVAEVIAWIAARVPLIDLGVREPGLEGIIRRIYEDREVRM